MFYRNVGLLSDLMQVGIECLEDTLSTVLRRTIQTCICSEKAARDVYVVDVAESILPKRSTKLSLS